MPVSKALGRLLRIRELEEGQCRLALEAALGEQHRLEDAWMAMAGLDRRGRRLVESSVRSGELGDRLAGLHETGTAVRAAGILEPLMAGCADEVARLRQEYLEKRVERRQAETLIRETEARDAIESGRRNQQALDDWFRARLHRMQSGAEGAGGGTDRDEDLLNEGQRGKT